MSGNTMRQLNEFVSHEELHAFVRQSAITTVEDFADYLYEELDHAIKHVQHGKDHLHKAGHPHEDLITHQICLVLAGSRKLHADHDAHNNGNVDITIKYKDYVWLGEAKIYHDNSNIMEGWRQLVNRYSTGEEDERFGGLLIYFFVDSVLDKMRSWSDYLKEREEGLVFRQCERRKICLVSEHEHRISQETVEIRHMPVMLQFAPDDASARKSKLHSAQ